jgi:hypothetical protein
MKVAWLNALLWTAIVVGAACLWRSSRENVQLRAEADRLKSVTGELVPADPTQIYVRAIKTDDPLEFAWRVYFPPGYQLQVRHKHGYSSSSALSNAIHGMARVRLREVDGVMQIYQRLPDSSGLSSINPELQQFLRGRWDRLQVEQLGKERLEQLDPKSEFILFRLTLPEDLQKEAESKLPKGMRSEFMPSLLEIRVGPPGGKS